MACEEAVESPVSLLRSSFADQIAGVSGVDAFARNGQELTFTHLNFDGDGVAWRVVIDSVVVDPEDPDLEPVRGDIVSSWYADGMLVEALGSMSRLPDAFLEAGLAQQCYALWDTGAVEWGW